MFELVKQEINIVRHIEKHIPLSKAGRLLHGMCPFHGDKATPSFTVYPHDNSWHCFGCHEGGSIIDFEMHRLNASAVEAAKSLCDEYGLHPTYADSYKFQRALALRKQKQEWFDSLMNSFDAKPDIFAYVKKRGLSDQTIKDFSLGAGESTNSVVIPIKDKFGKVAGFARRNLDTNAKEKYINDSTDQVYNKSEILFNLDKVKYIVKSSKAIILNEGYFDTMAWWECGLKHAVAFCSSRLTKEQSQVLQDVITEETTIYLVPTNDETAQKELEKNLEVIHKMCPKNHVRAVTVPEGCKDINDVLIDHGKDAVLRAYNESISVEMYFVKRIIKNEPILEMQYNKIKNYCAKVEDLMIKEDICTYLGTVWDKSKDSIRAYILNKSASDSIDANSYKRIDMLVQEYDQYVAELKTNRINFGWHKTDMITRGMHIGDVVMMIASTGVGKTLWAENLILNLTKQYPDLPVMFFSLEQMGIMAFERLMMMEGQLESKQVEKWYKNEDNEVAKRVIDTMDILSNNCKNFVLIDEGAMTLKKLEKFVSDAPMRVFTNPVKVVVIDYLGYLQGEGQDLYHKVTAISKEMKELAKRLKCVIVCLAQVSKVGKSGGDPIEGYMARDSGVVQESADIMISAWRPELKEGITDAEKKDLEGVYMTKIAKNKYGEAGAKIEFMFVKKYLKLLEKRDEPMHVDEQGKISG